MVRIVGQVGVIVPILSLLDNIYSVKSFLVRKQGMGSKEVDQALEITEDFDSLEYPACLCN